MTDEEEEGSEIVSVLVCKENRVCAAQKTPGLDRRPSERGRQGKGGEGKGRPLPSD